MRIIQIGASGTIGSAVYQLLSGKHEVIKASRSDGDLTVDISSPDSIRAMYAKAETFDAVVCTAGQARFGELSELTGEDFDFCLANKLMGQVNLVRIGRELINEWGSFTLTSGVLAQHPMPGSSAISLVNAGLEGFVRAAALEMVRGIRINVVSPPWVRETLERMGRDPLPGMPAAHVAKGYQKSVESSVSGEVITP